MNHVIVQCNALFFLIVFFMGPRQGCDDSVGRDGIQDGTGRVFSKIPLESLLSRGTGRDGTGF